MVSFVCDDCQSTLKKNKVQSHSYQCGSRSFSCIDCGVTFDSRGYSQHNQCISEAEKYEGKLYRGKKGKQQNVSNPAQLTSAPTTAAAPVADVASDAKVTGKRKRADDEDAEPQPHSAPTYDTAASDPAAIDSSISALVAVTLQSASDALPFRKLSKAVRKAGQSHATIGSLSKPAVEAAVWRALQANQANVTLGWVQQ